VKVLPLVLLATITTTVSAASDSYEVWGCDQSNSVPNLDSLGTKGSLLWIWGEDDIDEVIETGVTPKSKGCTPDAAEGPCDLLDML
jgi:hypothetical protein